MPKAKAKSIVIGTLCGSIAVLLVGVPVAVLKYVLHVGDLADSYGVPFWEVVHGIGFGPLVVVSLVSMLSGFLGALQGALTRTLYGWGVTFVGLAGISAGTFAGLTIAYGSADIVAQLPTLGVLCVGFWVSVGAVVLVDRKTSREEDDPDGDDAPATAANSVDPQGSAS